MASRRKARELALQMMFQWDVGKHTPDQVEAAFLQRKKLEPETETLARELFEGSVNEISALDQLLREHAENWRPDRMAALDRNLLRMATYELIHHRDTPTPVVINEALELARRYSGEDSVQFVNGVLDSIRKVLSLSKAGS